MGVIGLNLVKLLAFYLLLLNSVATAASPRSNETDQLSLLAFKASIVDDPHRTLSYWNESNHFCKWHGVTCSRRHQRVTVLNLHSLQLVGSISPHVGNLSFLRELNLQNNSLSNEIPAEIGNLRKLQNLSLGSNSFTGEFPANISSCLNLISLNLSYNVLQGNIPMRLGFLSKLKYIIIHNNRLTGSIAPFGNLSSLVGVSAAENNFTGAIPDALGRLLNLQIVYMGVNRLSGVIPPSIFNCSSITSFEVTENQIDGTLPEDLGITLPNLEYFNIGANGFTGTIPSSISNASNLQFLIMVQNELEGKVPNLENLGSLEWLSISDNRLGSGKANDLSFISSLVNATNLQVLAVNQNNFGGMLPESIGNLSTRLEVLYLDYNQIYGKIPTGIVNILNLQSLYMENNQLTGTIPTDIGKLQNLHELNLITNRLSGNIPSSIGNLSLLIELGLGRNNLLGTIPPSLGKCENLQKLFLSQNNLSGIIPVEVISLSSLSIYLHLSQNQLSGSLPVEVGSLINLGLLDVSNNNLSGEIPGALGSCVRLETIRMGGNSFSGTVPRSLRSLRGIRELDLSRNNLSGEIPDYFMGLEVLQNLNLSFNDFEGVVPRDGIFENVSAISVMGNDKLCGGVVELQLPKCNIRLSKKKTWTLALKLIVSITCGVLGVTFVVCLLYVCFFRKTRKTASSSSSVEATLLKVSYQSLLKATDGFSSANLIGLGSFGSVYKGVLEQDGSIIAVKVFNLLHKGASKSFVAECEALRNIRHRNLLKILTVCSGVDYQGNDFKALVYEYMNNGSLDKWLHMSLEENLTLEEPMKLSLLQRLNICVDIACALDYLHHDCQMPIVHCDLKPSNVLLDEEMTAHVGDFGLARFLSKEESSINTSSLGVRGSIGYTAPEYGIGNEVSIDGDVYSFGIVLLEMFTGKRPTNDMFKDGLNLHKFAKSVLPDRVADIVDPMLLVEKEGNTKSDDKSMECLVSILKIGVACSAELPRERMSSSDVAAELQAISYILIGTSSHTDRYTVNSTMNLGFRLKLNSIHLG